jgi:uncharacterized RDD family membrane protein YckC
MECSVCGVENESEALACRICGAKLTAVTIPCPGCQEANALVARYCRRCGASLAARPLAASPAEQQRGREAPSPGGLGTAAYPGYVGFRIRLVAWAADSALVFLAGLVVIVLSDNVYLAILAQLAYYTLFTGLKGQTPGKMLVGIKVVDERGQPPGIGRAALREIPGKFLSGIVLYLGFVWVAWDEKKQGWHDKLAHTHVIRERV